MKTKREKFKTLILILLIISSLVLAVLTWVYEKLWPTGYSFFSNFSDIPLISSWFGTEDNYSFPVDNLSKPGKIVVTNGEKRSVYYVSDSSFAGLHSVTRDFLVTVLTNEDMVIRRAAVSPDEWFDVLRNDELLDTKSIYTEFALSYTPDLFAQIMGVQHTWMTEPSAVRDFIIAPLGNDGTDMLLYARDANSDIVYKHYITYDKKADIVNAISEYTANESDNFIFSFEQNLDGRSEGIGGQVQQKVFVDSLVLLSLESTETDIITAENPIDTNNTEALNNLLSCFGYAPNSLRHYTAADETQYFVENYGSLLIHPSGIIEYTALDTSKAYDLFEGDNTTRTLYETLNRAIEFSESVWNTVMPDTEFNALVTSDLAENGAAPGEYTFTLDYYFEGTPITVDAPNMKNAVIIEVKNGRITSYRHLIRRFTQTGESVENIPMIAALDALYTTLSKEENTEATIVTDLFLSYVEDSGQSTKTAVWCAKTEGSDEVRRLD